MNKALTYIPAAATALFSSKKASVRALVLGVAVICASAPVLAGQDRDGQRNGAEQQGQQGQRQERMAPPQQQPRQYDTRQQDARADEQRRQAQAQAQAQSQDQGRRGGRLTPDERRELRRQINEAGIDLYPNAPRR